MGNIYNKKKEEGMCGSKHSDDSEKHCAPLNSPKQSAFPPFSCSVALLLFACYSGLTGTLAHVPPQQALLQ